MRSRFEYCLQKENSNALRTLLLAVFSRAAASLFVWRSKMPRCGLCRYRAQAERHGGDDAADGETVYRTAAIRAAVSESGRVHHRPDRQYSFLSRPAPGPRAQERTEQVVGAPVSVAIADWVAEAHDTHHPISGGLYYEDQKKEAKRRAADFTADRIPKYLGYFERILKRSSKGGGYLLGKKICYADLSLFQIIEGLRYAFPRVMARLEPKHPLSIALHDRIAARPRLAAYLSSERRIPFNQEGIFRHYPELDE